MRTARQAVDQMIKWHDSGKGGFKGWCLRTCRTAWGIPGKYPSAIEAWKAIPASKKNTVPGKAPIGAVHFFDIGKFGHIVIQSDTVGMVWGTDAPDKDKVGLVKLSWFSQHWHAKYLGWSTNFNGVDLPCHELPKRVLKDRILGVKTTVAIKEPVSSYDHAAAAKGGGVDDVKKKAAAKKAVPAKKAVVAAKKVAKKAVVKKVAK